MSKKIIKERIVRQCSICPKKINVILYTDDSYRGGHYFNLDKPKKRPKTLEEIALEYWECPTCYWSGK